MVINKDSNSKMLLADSKILIVDESMRYRCGAKIRNIQYYE